MFCSGGFSLSLSLSLLSCVCVCVMLSVCMRDWEMVMETIFTLVILSYLWSLCDLSSMDQPASLWQCTQAGCRPIWAPSAASYLLSLPRQVHFLPLFDCIVCVEFNLKGQSCCCFVTFTFFFVLQDSAEGIIRVIEGLSDADNGTFIQYDGRRLKWWPQHISRLKCWIPNEVVCCMSIITHTRMALNDFFILFFLQMPCKTLILFHFLSFFKKSILLCLLGSLLAGLVAKWLLVDGHLDGESQRDQSPWGIDA